MTTIAALKQIARHHRLEYLRLTEHFDCGADLAEHFKPEAVAHRKEYEDALECLRKLDPAFPKKETV